MDPETVKFLIVVIGCLIGIFGFWFGRKDAATNDAKNDGILSNELSHIGNDVKDVKAEIRSFRSDVNEAKSTALQAKALAETAHDRLDSLGAASSYEIRRTKKE